MVLIDCAVMIRNVIQVSLRQSGTPDELLGRVSGAHRLVTYGAIPLGAMLGGAVASAGGLRAAMVLASAIFGALAIFATCTITRARIAAIAADTTTHS
ncbi:hypothetical protein [Solihabitans fulvus]|uniref:hypothetical protein n=1 Tax=Solihabitans fulvus TaxID=1892852 RepID=UPI001661C5DE|nr:hypothetical protein [Solihabitans fulvus]